MDITPAQRDQSKKQKTMIKSGRIKRWTVQERGKKTASKKKETFSALPTPTQNHVIHAGKQFVNHPSGYKILESFPVPTPQEEIEDHVSPVPRNRRKVSLPFLRQLRIK